MNIGVQDGKRSLEGHFTKAMKHVNRFWNRGNDVIALTGLVIELVSKDIMPNAVVELIAINRTPVNNLLDKYTDEI